MKRLIVNADDLGLTEGVNRAVFELHAAGVLTSSTLMANAEYALSAAQSAPVGLGLGCHVVLVDGTPVLPPGEIASLIDNTYQHRDHAPRFRSTLGAFLTDLYRGRILEAHIEAEAAAQIARVRALGVRVTHVDTHKHTHMFPRVLRPVVRAAMLNGVRSIRNPFEPEWSVSATPRAGLLRRLQVKLLSTQRHYFLSACHEAGLRTTEGALGVLATGTLDAAALQQILRAIPDGDWELVCHPGYRDAPLEGQRTRLKQSREIERAALLRVIPEELASIPSLKLIHFGQLPSATVKPGEVRRT